MQKNENQTNQQQYKFAIDAVDRLISKVKPATSSKMKSTVVALYTSDSHQTIRYSSKIAILHLDYDRLLKNYLLRLYDPEYIKLLLQVQLYYGFMQNFRLINNSQGTKNLYGFDYLSEGVIAFMFKNQLEAQIMYHKLKSIAPTKEQYKQIQMKQIEQELKKKKQNSFFGKLKNKMFKKEQKITQQSTVIDVSNVTAKSNIRFDIQNGSIISDISNLPPQWEQIVQYSGLTIEDLGNQDIAQIVIEQTIIHETKKAMEKDPQILAKSGYVSIKEMQDDQTLTIDTNNNQSELENEKPLVDFLPLPPPPPTLDLRPPTLQQVRLSSRISSKRQNLLNQIRNNNIKLKPVKKNQKGDCQLDASQMNKEERIDLASHIKMKLQMRKIALQRRNSDSQDEDNE